jgi:hypothetical protein
VLAVTDEKSNHRYAGVGIGEDEADEVNEVAMSGGERGDI